MIVRCSPASREYFLKVPSLDAGCVLVLAGKSHRQFFVADCAWGAIYFAARLTTRTKENLGACRLLFNPNPSTRGRVPMRRIRKWGSVYAL
jgi:hypothetical protein